jgi:leucyl aminopeptidase
MSDGKNSKSMEVFAGDPRHIDTDLLVVAAFEEQVQPLASWSAPTRSDIDRAIGSREFTGKLYETFFTPVVDGGFRAVRLGVVGLGPQSDFTFDRARRAAAAIGILARQKKIPRLAFIAEGALEQPEMIQAVAEGLTLAEFEPGRYKTAGYEPFQLRGLGICVSGGSGDAAGRAVQRGRIIGRHCNMARELDNEPGNALSPSVFAGRLADIVRDGGLSAEVLDHTALERLGMGMLLGVGRGSAEPPRLVTIRYEPPHAAERPVLGLIGKGITFDTGGISIKPAADMERMKDDMAGGAAVACAMRAMKALDAPVRVLGVIPIAENMPGGVPSVPETC